MHADIDRQINKMISLTITSPIYYLNIVLPELMITGNYR